MRRSHWTRGITLSLEQRDISSFIWVHRSAFGTGAAAEVAGTVAGAVGEAGFGGGFVGVAGAGALAPGAGAVPARAAGCVAPALPCARRASAAPPPEPGGGSGVAVASGRTADAGSAPVAGPASVWDAGGADTPGFITSRDASSSAAFRASRSFRASSARAPGVDPGDSVAGTRPPVAKMASATIAASATMPASATNRPPRLGAAA